MAEEEKRCEECGSESFLDTVYLGKMAKLCRNCAFMNGAVIIKKPTTEQITKSEKEVSLTERVKAWRKARQGAGGPSEANLETLRRRKQELEREEAKRKEELIERPKQGSIDFRSKEVTISDLKKIQQEKQKQWQEQPQQAPQSQQTVIQTIQPQKPSQPSQPSPGPMPLPLPQPMPPRLEKPEKPEDEIEITGFMQEVQRVNEEEQLEELFVPVPLEPLQEEQEEQAEEQEKAEEPKQEQETEQQKQEEITAPEKVID